MEELAVSIVTIAKASYPWKCSSFANIAHNCQDKLPVEELVVNILTIA